LTATQTINVKGGLDPVISGGALTVGAIILAVAIPGPIDDGALAGAGYAVCRTIQLCR